jgi:hypothetical protein
VIDLNQLIEFLRANPQAAQDGSVAYRVLQEMHHGRPVEDLRLLLEHSETAVVECGAWIASEMGRKARPLLDEMGMLLKHRSAPVRHDALESVLACSSGDEIGILGEIPRLLDDRSREVRLKAMDFLARASDKQLEGAKRGLEADRSSSVHCKGVELVLGCHQKAGDEIMRMCRTGTAIERKYAVIASARRADLVPEDHVLEAIGSGPDEESAKFAEAVLHVIRERPSIRGHRWR